MRCRTLFLGKLIAAAFVCATCAGRGAGKTAYVGAHVFDGTGAALITNAVIIVADGHIEAVGPADQVSVPRGAEVVDVAGRWIIPGLIDAFARPERWALAPMLSYGVTSIRAVGGIQDTALFLRTDVQSGAMAGPRLFVTGAYIDGTPAPLPGATAARTTSDARRAVDNRVLIDASFVAIGPKVTRPLLTALLAEARALEAPVSAELGRVDAVTAARAGVTAIDRLSGIVEATARNASTLLGAHGDYDAGRILAARSWSGLDSTSLHRTASALNAEGVWLVPTLVAHETLARLTDQPYLDSLDLSGVPEDVRETWNAPGLMQRIGLSRSDVSALRQSRPAQDLFVRLYHREGGRVVPGSTAPDGLLAPGEALHRELELLVGAGLTTEEVLLAATRGAAALLRADTVGTIRPGAVADFVVLDRNPLVDIRSTRRITLVVTYGVSYPPEELRDTR